MAVVQAASRPVQLRILLRAGLDKVLLDHTVSGLPLMTEPVDRTVTGLVEVPAHTELHNHQPFSHAGPSPLSRVFHQPNSISHVKSPTIHHSNSSLSHIKNTELQLHGMTSLRKKLTEELLRMMAVCFHSPAINKVRIESNIITPWKPRLDFFDYFLI